MKIDGTFGRRESRLPRDKYFFETLFVVRPTKLRVNEIVKTKTNISREKRI